MPRTSGRISKPSLRALEAAASMTGKLKALPGGTAARTYAEVLKGLPNTTENADGTLATPELSAIEPKGEALSAPTEGSAGNIVIDINNSESAQSSVNMRTDEESGQSEPHNELSDNNNMSVDVEDLDHYESSFIDDSEIKSQGMVESDAGLLSDREHTTSQPVVAVEDLFLESGNGNLSNKDYMSKMATPNNSRRTLELKTPPQPRVLIRTHTESSPLKRKSKGGSKRRLSDSDTALPGQEKKRRLKRDRSIKSKKYAKSSDSERDEDERRLQSTLQLVSSDPPNSSNSSNSTQSISTVITPPPLIPSEILRQAVEKELLRLGLFPAPKFDGSSSDSKEGVSEDSEVEETHNKQPLKERKPVDVDGSISDSGSDDSKDFSQEVKLSGKVTKGLKALHDSIQELERCEVDDQLQSYKDELLSYRELVPLQCWGMLDGSAMQAVSLQTGIFEMFKFDWPKRSGNWRAMKRLFETACYDSKHQFHNLARQDPRLFTVQATPGFSGANAMLKYRNPTTGKPVDCAFLSYGVLAEATHIFQQNTFPSKRSTPNNPQYYRSKSTQVLPIRYEFARMVSAAQMIFDTDPANKAYKARYNITMFKKAPTFATGIRSADEEKAGSLGLDSASAYAAQGRTLSARQAQQFYHDLQLPYMKRPQLSPDDIVPIFDASEYFKKGKGELQLNFAKIGEQCPIINRELNVGDLVAVMHSVSHTVVSGVPSFQFGPYALILLARGYHT